LAHDWSFCSRLLGQTFRSHDANVSIEAQNTGGLCMPLRLDGGTGLLGSGSGDELIIRDRCRHGLHSN
jgi:hypothetical protein